MGSENHNQNNQNDKNNKSSYPLPQFNQETMAETILNWSNINTGSFNAAGLEIFSEVLIKAFNELSCEVNKIHLPPIELYNDHGQVQTHPMGPLLSFSKRKGAPIRILLMGHMDTVFDRSDSFQKAFRKNNETIIGPGVTDMKGGLLVMLEALKAFEKTPFAEKLGWEVLINPDEEIGSLASGPLFKEKIEGCKLALLFEPAMDESGTLAGERKGSARFTIMVHGKAAHAGRDFHQGKNAIVTIAEIIKEIDQLNGQKEGVTINIGNIRGGEAVNVVPAFAIVRLDVRYLESEQQAWIEQNLQKIILHAEKKEGFKIELHGKFNRPPKKMSDPAKKLYDLIITLAKQLDLNLGIRLSGGCSDGNNLSALELPNVDTLGVCGGKIHSNEEYLIIKSMITRAELTFSILSHLAQHGF